MNLERVEKIAEAVLYEGYMLYPYRPSAVKNRQRWNFGVLCPESQSEEASGRETSTMQTECLVLGDASTRLDIRVRFLQILTRKVGRLPAPAAVLPTAWPEQLEFADRLEVEGRIYQSWEEAMEREVLLPAGEELGMPARRALEFEFAAGAAAEPILTRDGGVAGAEVREWQSIRGSVEIEAKSRAGGVYRLRVRVANLTAPALPPDPGRGQVLAYSLVSVHTLLGVEQGQFVSMIDPPQHLRRWADQCRNVRTWPVLAGEEGAGEAMVSSPIILYDYPRIAPESPGSLFDGTEIDEILSLRILTMTEEEKAEMRQSDERVRRILERTETMPGEQWMKLHGVLRDVRTLEASPSKEAP